MYKKLVLYMDNENKQYFKEANVSEEEIIKINNFFIIQKNGMRNPKKLFYIELLKPINPIRTGSTSCHLRNVYFNESDKEKAKKIILSNFKYIIGNRSKEALQNLSYLTDENLKFFNELSKPEKVEKIKKVEVKSKIKVEEKKEKIQKKEEGKK